MKKEREKTILYCPIQLMPVQVSFNCQLVLSSISITVEELTTSDWPVRMSVGGCLDCKRAQPTEGLVADGPELSKKAS